MADSFSTNDTWVDAYSLGTLSFQDGSQPAGSSGHIIHSDSVDTLGQVYDGDLVDHFIVNTYNLEAFSLELTFSSASDVVQSFFVFISTGSPNDTVEDNEPGIFFLNYEPDAPTSVIDYFIPPDDATRFQIVENGVLNGSAFNNPIVDVSGTFGEYETLHFFVYADAYQWDRATNEGVFFDGEASYTLYLSPVTGLAYEDPFNTTDGDDEVVGTGENDSVDLRNGNDSFSPGAIDQGDDSILGRTGNDTIDGGAGNDTLNGNAGADLLIGGAGMDVLNGNAGADVLKGGAGVDVLKGNAGADVLFGGTGADVLFGGTGADVLKGGGHKDLISGGNGADRIFGGGAADILSGGRGRDKLFGGAGKDVLYGGNGNDLLVGGGQADTFVFSGGFGHDRIKDFAAKLDAEKIDLGGVGAIVDWDDLRANHLEQVENDVVILSDGNSITLLNTDLLDLGAEDFLF